MNHEEKKELFRECLRLDDETGEVTKVRHGFAGYAWTEWNYSDDFDRYEIIRPKKKRPMTTREIEALGCVYFRHVLDRHYTFAIEGMNHKTGKIYVANKAAETIDDFCKHYVLTDGTKLEVEE